MFTGADELYSFEKSREAFFTQNMTAILEVWKDLSKLCNMSLQKGVSMLFGLVCGIEKGMCVSCSIPKPPHQHAEGFGAILRVKFYKVACRRVIYTFLDVFRLVMQRLSVRKDKYTLIQ